MSENLLALCSSSNGAGIKIGRDGVISPGTELGSAGHPGRQVAFETLLVDVARSRPVNVLAGWLVHDIALEEDVGGVQ